jgi:hypothetical protein
VRSREQNVRFLPVQWTGGAKCTRVLNFSAENCPFCELVQFYGNHLEPVELLDVFAAQDVMADDVLGRSLGNCEPLREEKVAQADLPVLNRGAADSPASDSLAVKVGEHLDDAAVLRLVEIFCS